MASLSDSLRELQSVPAQQWVERASTHLPRILAAVLAVAIAWQLVGLLWQWLDRAPTEDTVPMAAAPSHAFPVSRGIDVRAIVDAHLFGVSQGAAPGSQEAQPTQMNLMLSAVFAANDPRRGLAIIGDSAQSGKVYAAGEAIRPRIRLHEVYADRVILDNGGTLETLSLPKLSNSQLTIGQAPAPTPQPSQFAENLRNIAQNNPSAFTQIVRAQPVFANGVQRGFRVYPGRNRQQFAQLGLRPGDLVVAINGTPLDDPQRGREIFNTLSSSGQANLTVERNGQSQELTLNTAQITLPDVSAPADEPADQAAGGNETNGEPGTRRPRPTTSLSPAPQTQ